MVLAGKVRHGYGLVLDCIDSWFLPSSLLRRIKDQTISWCNTRYRNLEEITVISTRLFYSMNSICLRNNCYSLRNHVNSSNI